MKKCPKCGNKKFIVTAHVTQDWLVDENETFLECLNECVEIIHKPDNEDMWKCIICDYQGIGKEFERKNNMKIKDLIKMNIDIDVCDNVTQELDISFVGPIKLTEEGKKQFKEVLEYEVTLYEKECWASVKCNDQEPKIKWIEKFKKAQQFFFACAGYCSAKDYDKWFKEVN